jgi:hypothetical protein
MPGAAAGVYAVRTAYVADGRVYNGVVGPGPRSEVYLWEDGAFTSLAEDDERRVVNNGAACFFMIGWAGTSASDTPWTGPGTSTTVYQGVAGSQAYFLVPITAKAPPV